MYALYDDDLKGVCVVTPGDDGSCELKILPSTRTVKAKATENR